VFECTLLALIRWVRCPSMKTQYGSTMKTHSGNNPWTDIVVMGKARNFLGFMTAILYSLPPIPSPDSLSHSSDVSCSNPLEVRPLTSSDFGNFPKNYSVNYSIDVCVVLQFHAIFLYSYILAIMAPFEFSFHFRTFPIIADYLFLLIESRDMDLSLNCPRAFCRL